MSSIADTFRDEAAELLQELEAALLALEETPEETSLVDRVFRALHTLKGAGGLAGFDVVAELCHEAETTFEEVRSGEHPLDRELVSLTLAAKDLLRLLIEAEFGGAPVDPARVSHLLAAFRQRLGETASSAGGSSLLTDGVSSGLSTYRIRFRPGPGIFRQGIQPQLLLGELCRLGDAVVVAQLDKVPPLDQLDPEECHVYWDVILTTAEDENAIRDVFIFVEDDCELSVQMIDADGLLDDAGDYKKLGEILVERGDLPEEDLEKFLAEKKRLGETLIAAGVVAGGQVDSALAEQDRVQRLRRERQAVETSDSIRVKSERLDKLVNLIGEMVTVQARLSQLSNGREDAALLAVAEEVERLTWELRDQVLTIRMLPIGSTFSRFKRLVRDLGDELGKDVMLFTEGGETELDKTVIERLGDPLVHLIRNCIGHGIEAPEARRVAGKSAKGRITLSAEHSGANVLISVADDGMGLDRDRIRAKAIERGLLAPQAEVSDREIFNLIFLPGFSTAEQVSNVSGRGVGMDVVRQAIESLRGSVEVGSQPGRGSCFTLKLPLTLAIIDGLMVSVGGEQFIMPLADVEECIALTRTDRAATHGRDLVNVRDEIVPFIPLRETFAVGGEHPEMEQVVIARLEGKRVGFLVDHVVGEHQTVIKNLGRFYHGVSGISGATILGDGHVALILDLPQLAERAEQREQVAWK
ncbi:MAG: chemotaxis protein CheA [Desulfuromonadales bacterium]|nr:chemotaxis protein CheA [Desulfuromonadales bacterium]